MKRVMVVMLLSGLSGLSGTALAAPVQTMGLWARATAPGADTAAVYGVIVNTGDEAQVIVSVGTDIATKTMIHRTMLEDSMMKMRHVKTVTITAGGRVEFEPGGLHIMLTGLAGPLGEGDEFELTLFMADGTATAMPVKVGTIGQMSYPDDKGE